jgi:hypothetical protein
MKKWSDLNKKEKTRGVALLVIIFSVFLIFASPSKQNDKIEPVQNNVEQSENFEKLSVKDQIRSIAEGRLQGKNNLDTDYVRSVEVKEDNELYAVEIDFNADDNLTTNLRKTGIEKKMSEIYTSLFTKGYNIEMVKINAYFPLMDEYGNEFDGAIYKTVLYKDDADKINWDADEATLDLQILPELWTVAFIHPEFK